jgi:PAS domain S-box-containing protein
VLSRRPGPDEPARIYGFARPADGLRWVRLAAHAVGGGVVGTSPDVTAEIQAARALADHEATFRELFEGTADLVVTFAPTGEVLLANRSWREALGIGEADVRRLPFLQRVAEEDREAVRAILDQLAQGAQAPILRASLLGPGNLRVPVEGTLSARMARGEVRAFQGIFRDVTLRERVEAELRETNVLLGAIAEAQAAFIAATGAADAADRLLAAAESCACAAWGMVLCESGAEPTGFELLAARSGGREVSRRFADRRELGPVVLAAAGAGRPMLLAEETPLPAEAVPRGFPASTSIAALPYHSAHVRGVLVVGSTGTPLPATLPSRLAPLLGTLAQLVAASRAVSERRAAAAMLQGREAFLRALHDAAGDGIVVVTAVGVIMSVNPAAERILGWPAAEIVGRPFNDFASRLPVTVPGVQDPPGLDPGGGRRAEFTVTRQDGASRSVEAYLTRVELQANRWAILAILHDLTERQEVERVKSQFIATVSHELRTPLTSVVGSLTLLAAGAVGTLPGEASGMVEIALQNAQRLVRLVNDILDIERLELGQLSLRMGDVDLASVAADSAAALEGVAKASGASVRLSVESCIVTADADRLGQVIANLLANALRFSAAGHVVEVMVRHGEEEAIVEVSDQGPGISPDFAPRGLHPVRDRARAPGPGPGNGSRLEHLQGACRSARRRDRLPGAATGRDDVLVHGAARRPRRDAELTSLRRVLVVEDDPDVREIARLALHVIGGLEVAVASDGPAALLLHRDFAPDVVLLDLMMPGMDGSAVLQALRASGAGTPVIFMTARAGHRDREPLLAQGSVEVIAKPFDARLLAGMAREAWERARA